MREIRTEEAYERDRKIKTDSKESDNIVFFGGAGVSTESGIPDFRSVDGLYHQKYEYPPETILSHTFLCVRQKNFIAFTEIRCLHWMQNRMLHTKNWQNWKRLAN